MKKALKFLERKGYKIHPKIEPPDADCPLDAISIQHELTEFGYRLQYVGNVLKLVKTDEKL